jgi:glucan-binding YG repeat protein
VVNSNYKRVKNNTTNQVNTDAYKESNKSWKKEGENWTYIQEDGTKVTGWLRDKNGEWYKFNKDGVMQKNTIIDGYSLGSDGAWDYGN